MIQYKEETIKVTSNSQAELKLLKYVIEEVLKGNKYFEERLSVKISEDLKKECEFNNVDGTFYHINENLCTYVQQFEGKERLAHNPIFMLYYKEGEEQIICHVNDRTRINIKSEVFVRALMRKMNAIESA